MSGRMLLASGWTLIVLVLCWMPRQHLPIPEEGYSFQHVRHLDKVVHFGMFAVLGALWSWVGLRRGVQWRVILFGAALAVLTEIGQLCPYVQRDADVFDALADLIGTIAGVAGVTWAIRPRAVRASGDGEANPPV